MNGGASSGSRFLKDPEALYPGQRKMVNYHFSDAEIADVIAFLKWVGKST